MHDLRLPVTDFIEGQGLVNTVIRRTDAKLLYIGRIVTMNMLKLLNARQ